MYRFIAVISFMVSVLAFVGLPAAQENWQPDWQTVSDPAELNLTWQQAVVRLPVIAGDKRGYFLRDEVRDLLSSIGFSEIETVDRHEWYRELAKWVLEQMSGPRREEFVRESGEENLQAAIIANQELVSVVNSGELRPTHVRARWLQ